jgi:putative chitobiose transport system permease protein
MVKRLLLYAVLFSLALFTVFPLLWLFGVALKSEGSIFGFPPQIIPWPITLKNFIEVWRVMPLFRFFMNSIILTAAGIILNVTLSAMAAYPLARMNFRGKNFIFSVILATLILPSHIGLIVNFVTLSKLSLIDTYIATLLPGAVSVFGIFLLRQAYLNLPKEIEDAARIDGAGEFTIWFRIMTPLIIPQLATLAIFEFVALWNSFLWPLIVLKNPAKYPLAVGLLYLQGIFSHNTRLVAAGAIILILPIIVMFLLFQRYFIRGLTAGAIH